MSRCQTTEPFRRCSGSCERMLELTVENFRRHPTCRNGFHSQCRDCVTAGNRASQKRKREHLARIRAAARSPLQDGQICDECFDLGHRRAPTGCARCGLPWEAEPPLELMFHRHWAWAI